MNYYQLLRDGYKIIVSTKKGCFYPTTFWYDGGVWVDSSEVGEARHPTFRDDNFEEFNEHITRMLKKGLRIIIELKD